METAEAVTEAVAILRRGGLVAFPTETVYGLGADATNPQALERLFAVKGRPRSHPLIVHVRSAGAMLRYAESVPDTAMALAREYWPGPLTMVLRRGSEIDPAVAGGLETVGLRCPDHPIALALLSEFDGPIAAPSANRFGAVSPTTADHVRGDLGGDVDLILDGGRCRVGIESTIVDLSTETPVLLRPGAVTRAAIEATLGCVVTRAGADAKAPGRLLSHYAPRARVEVVAPKDIAARAARLASDGARVAVLVRGESPIGIGKTVTVIPLSTAIEDAAREFYAALREVDARGVDIVLSAGFDDGDGLAAAIGDRLLRAAGPR